MVENLPARASDAEDVDLTLGLRRPPCRDNDNPLQYSCLGNPMDRARVREVAKESDGT